VLKYTAWRRDPCSGVVILNRCTSVKAQLPQPSGLSTVLHGSAQRCVRPCTALQLLLAYAEPAVAHCRAMESGKTSQDVIDDFWKSVIAEEKTQTKGVSECQVRQRSAC
jgi:hypothetical protein